MPNTASQHHDSKTINDIRQWIHDKVIALADGQWVSRVQVQFDNHWGHSPWVPAPPTEVKDADSEGWHDYPWSEVNRTDGNGQVFEEPDPEKWKWRARWLADIAMENAIRSYPGTSYPMGISIGIRAPGKSRIWLEAELPVRDMDLFAWHMFIGRERVGRDFTGKHYDDWKVSELGSPKDEAKDALGTLEYLTNALKHVVRHGTIVTDRYVPGPYVEFEHLDPCEAEYYLAKVKAALLQRDPSLDEWLVKARKTD